jgi:quercetin dioxygenase-like cupin family protein
MSERDVEEQLRKEGFFTYVHSDGPNAHYPDHTHDQLTAHIILKGEMWLTLDGKKHFLKSGDRLDIPKDAVHSAKMGPKGCTYLVGEK